MSLHGDDELPLEGKPPRAPVEGTWRVASNPEDALISYLLYRRHLFAYEAACRKAGHWRVAVDMPCGLGIGVPLLSRNGARVIAVDLASKALHSLPNTVLRLQADAARIPLADRSADLVVSFQLIEHVPPETAIQILAEIRRVLRPGAFGFVTTPNARWRLLPGQRPWNPYHVHEYRPRQILHLCKQVGIEGTAVAGVIGRHGAQALECARVRQSPLLVYGGRYGRRIHRFLKRLASSRRQPPPLDPDGPVTGRDRLTEWFQLSPDYENGLDFWIEVRGR